MRVSRINDCPFCVDLNSATLLRRGVSPAKIEVVYRWRECDVFGERERVALEYAEAVTWSDRSVNDALISQLRTHFDGDAIV